MRSVNASAHWSKEIFGWMKTIGGCRRTRFIELGRTQLAGYFVAGANALVQIQSWDRRTAHASIAFASLGKSKDAKDAAKSRPAPKAATLVPAK